MELILLLKGTDHIVRLLIHHMYCTAVYIENDIISVILIQMYHKGTSLSFYIKACTVPGRFQPGRTCIRQRLIRPLPSPIVLLLLRI